MTENSSSSGDWLPNYKQFFLFLLAGIFFASQPGYHDSRPAITPNKPIISKKALARPWQDPFEAVNNAEKKEAPSSDTFKEEFDKKLKISGGTETAINIIAVMLPSGFYYEDKEQRRKLRYAVLSGFNAALDYMPEDERNISYVNIPPKATCNSSPPTSRVRKSTSAPMPCPTPSSLDNTVVYEWLVYKQTQLVNDDKGNVTKIYERPPVLVLWLNKDQFASKPQTDLQDLINRLIESKNIKSVSVIGPYDSQGLQDLYNEFSTSNKLQDLNIYSYFSPNATIQESNLFCQTQNQKQQTELADNKQFCNPESTSLHRFFKDKGSLHFRIKVVNSSN